MQEPTTTRAAPRILIAPDSFKGSLDAAGVAQQLAAGLRRALPAAQIDELPIADGGEGTAATVAAALGGAWEHYSVTDANGAPRDVAVAICSSPTIGRFAVFDVAQIVGLPDAVAAPAARTTVGVGQLIRMLHARDVGAIVIGLGGSSTNDAGAGLLAELAYDFSDAAGAPLRPVFGNLADIAAVARRAAADALAPGGVRLIGLTDVTSPLNGPQGASMIFGGQKGYTELPAADARLAGFAGALARAFPEAGVAQIAAMPGAGAAGGLGFALALLGAQLQAGADFICDIAGVTARIGSYDWVITGEGRSDVQTLMGKGPATIAALARGHGVPVTLVAGAIEHDPALDAAFDGCFSIVPGPRSLEFAMANSADLLEQAGYRIGRLFAARR